MLKKTEDDSLRIKLFDLVKIKCNFHYHRSGEYEHVALSICNADTQCAVCRRFQFYAILKIIVYERLDQQLSLSTWLRTSRAESYGITKLNYKYCTSKHGPKLGVHRSLRSSESLLRDRVSK